MTPNAFAKAVRALEQTNRIEELSGALVFFCPFSKEAERDVWLALEERPPEFIESISITVSGSDVPLSKGHPPVPGEVFRVVVRKRRVDGELRFLLADALQADTLSALERSSLVRIAEMEANATFATLFARFESWTVDPGAPYATSEGLVSPQKLVRDFTPGAEAVSADLRPWLLRVAPSAASRAYACWKRLACRRVLASLSNEVSLVDGATTYVFTGPPKRSLAEPADFDDALSDHLQASASWVYSEGRDVETRHLLFSNELARAHEVQVLASVVERSLESAKSAYSAHVKSGSRETLKALADLRKAVFEETQKISQRAQDLAGSLWKDVAIAAAPFVLKILPDTFKASDPIIVAVFPFAAALFLLFSFFMQVYVNRRYFKHQDESREVWKNALAVALSADEIKKLSDTPIRESLRDYKKVRFAVGAVYAILVAILLKVGIDHVPTEWWDWIKQTYDSAGPVLDRLRNWVSRQF
jgi:hypothetical protein